MLRDFEYELLGQTTTIQLIRGLAKVLTMKTGEDPYHVQALLQFQKIVSHFYLVSTVLCTTPPYMRQSHADGHFNWDFFYDC